MAETAVATDALSQVLAAAVPLLKDLALIGGGSFAGAWAAFRLERKARVAEQQQAECVAGNQALLALTTQFDTLRRLERGYIALYRGKPLAWFLMVPWMAPRTFLRVDSSSLAFLLQNAPQVLLEVVQAEEVFMHLVDALERREKLYLSELQPRIEATGLRELQPSRIEEVVGPRLTGLLKEWTEAIFETFGAAKERNERSFEALRNFMLSEFKSLKIVARSEGGGRTEQAGPLPEMVAEPPAPRRRPPVP